VSLSQQFLDKKEKKSNVYLNSDYTQLRIDIFKIINPLVKTEKRASLLTEDILEIVLHAIGKKDMSCYDKFIEKYLKWRY